MVETVDNRQRGQILILAALMMVVMLMLAGLVLDGGMLMMERRRAQTAADAAALAAAYDLLTIEDSVAAEAAARSAAFSYASQNGYNNDGTSNTVAVSIPPTSGPHAGDTKAVQVVISRRLSTFLMHLGTGNRNVAAGASGVGKVTTGVAPFSLLALDPHQCQSGVFGGNGTTTIAGSVRVNSDCQPDALYAQGSTVVTAESIQVTGGYNGSGHPTVSPEPVEGVPPVPDPLATLPPPNIGDLATRHASASHPDPLQINNGTHTLLPGIYYGGIVINGGHITLQSGFWEGGTWRPGIYYIAGGGFEVAGNANVTGQEIMIYNGRNPGPCTSHCNNGNYGSIDLSGTGRVELSPILDPTDPQYDPYNGVLIFQERGNTEDIEINGTDDFEVNGTIYGRDAHLDLRGNGTIGALQAIVESFTVTGNGTLTVPENDSMFHREPGAYLVQ